MAIVAYRYSKQKKHRNLAVRTPTYAEMVRWLARTVNARRRAATKNLWLEYEGEPATPLQHTRACWGR